MPKKGFDLNKAFSTYLKYLLSAGMVLIGFILIGAGILLEVPSVGISTVLVVAGVALILGAFGLNLKEIKKAI